MGKARLLNSSAPVFKGIIHEKLVLHNPVSRKLYFLARARSLRVGQQVAPDAECCAASSWRRRSFRFLLLFSSVDSEESKVKVRGWPAKLAPWTAPASRSWCRSTLQPRTRRSCATSCSSTSSPRRTLAVASARWKSRIANGVSTGWSSRLRKVGLRSGDPGTKPGRNPASVWPSLGWGREDARSAQERGDTERGGSPRRHPQSLICAQSRQLFVSFNALTDLSTSSQETEF